MASPPGRPAIWASCSSSVGWASPVTFPCRGIPAATGPGVAGSTRPLGGCHCGSLETRPMPAGATVALSPHCHTFVLAPTPSPRHPEPSCGSPARAGSVPAGTVRKLQEGLTLPEGPLLPEQRLLGHRSRSGLLSSSHMALAGGRGARPCSGPAAAEARGAARQLTAAVRADGQLWLAARGPRTGSRGQARGRVFHARPRCGEAACVGPRCRRPTGGQRNRTALPAQEDTAGRGEGKEPEPWLLMANKKNDKCIPP